LKVLSKTRGMKVNKVMGKNRKPEPAPVKTDAEKHISRVHRMLHTLRMDKDGVLTILFLNCYCEKYISVFLKRLLANATMYVDKWNHLTRLEVCHATAILNAEQKEFFANVNTLRNKVAHNIDGHIDIEMYRPELTNIINNIKKITTPEFYQEIEAGEPDEDEAANEFVTQLQNVTYATFYWFDWFAAHHKLNEFSLFYSNPQEYVAEITQFRNEVDYSSLISQNLDYSSLINSNPNDYESLLNEPTNKEGETS
jgi:hypothetical protein